VSTDAVWYSELGTMYAGAGRLPDAVTALERALLLEPERTTTRSALGFVLIGMGRARDAVPHLARAAAEDPRSGPTFARLALAHATIGDRPAAARAASQASQLAGSDARVLTMAGRAFRVAGFPVEAEAVYVRALQINPNDAESQRALTDLRSRRVP
jgi:predicted Zn-dependent protease